MNEYSGKANALRLTLVALSLLTVILLPGCKLAEKKFDNYLTAAHEIWGFSGSVLVAWKGKVIYERGFGYADQVFEQPNTPQTKFYIGSITKQFTAAAILKLAEQGKLSLDDPVTKYLPEYPEDPGKRITIHQLLTHTSGVPNYTEAPEVMVRRTRKISSAELLTFIQNGPLEFEPGTSFHYSNSGYIILGAIIERVSGQSYEAFLHRVFFKPLGMKNSGYAHREAAVPDQAVGYTYVDSIGIVNAPRIHLSVLHTAGALYSTVEDMVAWDRALYGTKALSRNSVRAMLTPYSHSYGYGWYIESLWGRTHTFHGGFLDGFNTTFERWVEDQLCIVVFSNEDDAPVKKIARGLAAILFQEDYDFPIAKTPVAIETDSLFQYEGVYEVFEGYYRIVRVEGDRLMVQSSDEAPTRILPEGPDLFFFQNDNTTSLRFLRDRSGQVDRHEVQDQRGLIPARKIADRAAAERMLSRTLVTIDPSDFGHYTGLYKLESHLDTTSDFTLTVARTEDELMAAPTGLPLEPIYPHSLTEFFYKDSEVRIKFILNAAGDATACILRMGNAEVSGTKIR